MKFITTFLALSGVVAVIFGAYEYTQKGPAEGISETKNDYQRDIASLRAENAERRRARDQEIKDLKEDFKAQLLQATALVLQRLDKLDDRLYDIQRTQREALLLKSPLHSSFFSVRSNGSLSPTLCVPGKQEPYSFLPALQLTATLPKRRDRLPRRSLPLWPECGPSGSTRFMGLFI